MGDMENSTKILKSTKGKRVQIRLEVCFKDIHRRCLSYYTVYSRLSAHRSRMLLEHNGLYAILGTLNRSALEDFRERFGT